MLPLSFRLVVLDNTLLIKKSLNILIQNGASSPPVGGPPLVRATVGQWRGMLTRSCAGIVSAPLWDSKKSAFAGLLTSTDYINVIQYYCQFPDEIDQVDQFRLSSLRGR